MMDVCLAPLPVQLKKGSPVLVTFNGVQCAALVMKFRKHGIMDVEYVSTPRTVELGVPRSRVVRSLTRVSMPVGCVQQGMVVYITWEFGTGQWIEKTEQLM